MTGTAARADDGSEWRWRQIHEPVAELCRRLLDRGGGPRPPPAGASGSADSPEPRDAREAP